MLPTADIMPPKAPANDSRQETFDRYWATREYCSADARTAQRIDFLESLMKSPAERLLDVGCGRGAVAARFAQKGHDVLAIDVSPQSVEWTRRQGVEARIIDLDTDPLPGMFDTIVCLETLQYVRDPLDVTGKLRDALNPGGELIISLPCEYHLLRRISILLTGKGPGGIDFPLTVFHNAEHRRLFKQAGLHIEETRPVSLVPPRWKLLVGCGQLAARWCPSLLAISVIYRLTRNE